MGAERFYDALSVDYDVFVDWPGRLAYELPLLEEWLARGEARSVLDVACGTGQHALALATRGYSVTGVDVSQAMIDRATEAARREDLPADFRRSGFGELAGALGERFDALLCLGNSIPHLLDEASLDRALVDFRQVLRPGGLVILQSRNFDRVLATQERFLPLQQARRGSEEWLFVRFYDLAGERITFNLLRLHRQGEEPWTSRAEATMLRAWRSASLEAALARAGLARVGAYGNLAGEPFDPETSGDLVLVARAASQSGS